MWSKEIQYWCFFLIWSQDVSTEQVLRLFSACPVTAKVLAARLACTWTSNVGTTVCKFCSSHQMLTFGLLKWMTVPSSLIIFTSSMPGILFTGSGTESVRLSLKLESSICGTTLHCLQIHTHLQVSGYRKLISRQWNIIRVPVGGTSSYVTFPFCLKIFHQGTHQIWATWELFKAGLQLLIVGGGGAVDHLLLPPDGALATDAHLRLKHLQLLLVHLELCNHSALMVNTSSWKIENRGVNIVIRNSEKKVCCECVGLGAGY